MRKCTAKNAPTIRWTRIDKTYATT
jgi:hypothetical protein